MSRRQLARKCQVHVLTLENFPMRMLNVSKLLDSLGHEPLHVIDLHRSLESHLQSARNMKIKGSSHPILNLSHQQATPLQADAFEVQFGMSSFSYFLLFFSSPSWQPPRISSTRRCSFPSISGSEMAPTGWLLAVGTYSLLFLAHY